MSLNAWIDRLRPYLRTLAFVSLILVGLGLLLEAVSGFIDLGYGASKGVSFSTGDGIWAALYVLLLLIAFLALFASAGARKGTYPSMTVMGVLFLAMLSLIVQGGGMFAITTSGSAWDSYAALSIAAGVVLLISLFILRGASTAMKFTGSIFAIAFTSLLIARLAAESGAPGGGYSLSSYLLTPYLPSYYFDPGTAFTALGIVGFTYLAMVAYLIVALGLLMYAVLRNTQLSAVAWLVGLVGILLYGIDMAWGNIAALANADWGFVSSNLTTSVTPVIAAVILAIVSFIIIAAAVVGMVVYGGGLAGMALVQPSAAQAQKPQVAPGTFCPSCGTQNPADNSYCKKCGAKLG